MHKNLKRKHKEIHDLQAFMSNGHSLRDATIQQIDFTKLDLNWGTFDLSGSVFLGCTFKSSSYEKIVAAGGVIFPNIQGLPYQKYRSNLYTWQELYETAKSGNSVDLDIYNHFSDSKYDPSLLESLCQRLHDHAIDDALRDYLKPDADGNYKKKIVGVMGGHGTYRTDPFYKKTAIICQRLTKEGYLVASGGGPGIMEATNLGAYFGNYEEQANGSESLAIPTWFYGHEPSNVFASHIAKYFSNSIREDTLLAICLHGILFSPGSAGTLAMSHLYT